MCLEFSKRAGSVYKEVPPVHVGKNCNLFVINRLGGTKCEEDVCPTRYPYVA